MRGMVATSFEQMRAVSSTEDPAAAIRRGAARLLAATGQAVLAEVPLGNGRRADLVGLDRAGRISIVEIKSCRADFAADRKWPEYLNYCDLFYFAVASDFPRLLLPQEHGLIVADRYGGEIIRAAPSRPLCAARRKAMLVRFGQVAAARLQALLDPAGPFD
jgi:hypothetical protein